MSEFLPPLLEGFKKFQLAFVAVKIGLPQKLDGGPRTVDQLARDLSLPGKRLIRLLRGLVWSGMLEVDRKGRFTLSKNGRKLVKEGPTTRAGIIRFHGEFFYDAWGHLDDYILHGSIPFLEAHGEKVFDLLGHDPELARVFNAPMTARTTDYTDAVAKLPCFNQCESMVDIGGGEGKLVVEILRHRPEMRGIVFDLPIVREKAENFIQTSGMAERCSFHEGSMFETLPGGADIYMMKWVLHDWDDESVLKIFRLAEANAPHDAGLLIIERIMASELRKALPLTEADLNMLCLNAGAERTVEEYDDLLGQAGFKINTVTPVDTRYGFSAIHAIRT